MTTVRETSNKELVRRFHTWNAVVVGVLVVAVALFWYVPAADPIGGVPLRTPGLEPKAGVKGTNPSPGGRLPPFNENEN